VADGMWRVKNPAGEVVASKRFTDWASVDHRPPRELLALMGSGVWIATGPKRTLTTARRDL
jgi:hypothetical protein